jgi:hypothetical protein
MKKKTVLVYALTLVALLLSACQNPGSASSGSVEGSNALNSSVSLGAVSLSGEAASYYSKIDFSSDGVTLRTSLGTLLNNAAYSIPSYDALKTTLPKSDLDPNGSGKMLGFYDETPLPTAWDNQATWNREHVWPKSWGNLGTNGPGADPHMLRPASVSVNSGRGNLYYGLSSDGSYWDPGQYLPKYRGIAARICFYMATRYWKSNGLDLAESPTANCMGKKSRLLEWNKAYPVDPTETHRNEVLYKLYNVRNPFIDCPSLATSIWGS